MLSTIYVTGISSATELRYTLDNNVIFLAHFVQLHKCDHECILAILSGIQCLIHHLLNTQFTA